jgi:hypothetical protein
MAISDEQIFDWLVANPTADDATIAAIMDQFDVTPADVARATGSDVADVQSRYEAVADTTTAPTVVETPTTGGLSTVSTVTDNSSQDKGSDTTTKTEIVDSPKTEVSETPTKTIVDTTTAATTSADTKSTLPTVTDYEGNTYNGTQLLTLAQQIAQNSGAMTGGAFKTKDESIGFDSNEANKLLGRDATATEQVLLDMARQLINSGVTDLSHLHAGDITSSANVGIDPDTGQYYALIPSADGETSTRRDLTADEVAKIRTEEIMGSGDEGSYVRRTIDDLVTGKGLFAGDKVLSQQDAMNDPLNYTIGQTYTGGGGTNYDLKFDPTTGKSIISANGFTTSDADTIMPIIMIASNFLLPGAGSLLTSTLVEAGMSEFASQIVSKAVLNGVTSGIMAEASGGKFGDGFLKGSVTGAISAGVAPMISTALPSDLSPAMNTALTKATTAFISATLNGQDGTKALGTSLLGSATSGGLGLVAGEIGLSGAEARLLTTTLAPVLTSLITNGNVDNNTLFNTVLMAGSTILANTGSESVTKTTDVTTSDATGGGSTTDTIDGGSTVDTTGGGLLTLTTTDTTGGDKTTIDTTGGGLSTLTTTDTKVGDKTTGDTKVTDTKVTDTTGDDTVTLTTTGNDNIGGLNLLARDAASTVGTGLSTAATVTGLANKLTSLTNTPKTKVDKTKANLVGALGTNKPKTTTTKVVKPTTLSTAKTTTKPTTLGALNTAKKTMTAQQMSQVKASKPAAKVNVANLIPIKKSAPPQRVDVKTLIPVKSTQLPAGLNTKKMG